MYDMQSLSCFIRSVFRFAQSVSAVRVVEPLNLGNPGMPNGHMTSLCAMTVPNCLQKVGKKDAGSQNTAHCEGAIIPLMYSYHFDSTVHSCIWLHTQPRVHQKSSFRIVQNRIEYLYMSPRKEISVLPHLQKE